MDSTKYDDFKYCMQDTSNIYIGAKISYAEILQKDDINFKFKAIVEHYLLREMSPETSLESDFYYMEQASFSYRTYQQLHAKLKINILIEKRTLFGKKVRLYKEELMSLHTFVAMPVSEKQHKGIVVQELILPKFALLSFVI